MWPELSSAAQGGLSFVILFDTELTIRSRRPSHRPIDVEREDRPRRQHVKKRLAFTTLEGKDPPGVGRLNRRAPKAW
jgi:hypothetical protein